MMRWLALLALLLFPSLAHAQTVTTKFSLNNTAWTDLGPGPLMLGITGVGVYAIGDAAPTITREGLNIVSGEAGPVFSASHVWAMMKDAPSGIAFVAPIVPGAGGGGTTGCSQATAYLARATGETAHASDLTTLICGLVTDGVWSKLDALYILAQQTQADARLNLVGTSYSLTGTATFTAYQGFSAFPGTGLDTGFNIATATSPHFTSSNANMGAWLYDAPDGGAIEIGSAAGGGSAVLAAKYTGASYFCYISYSLVPNAMTPPSANGFYSCDRPTSVGSNVYYNASLLGNDASGTLAFTSADITIGGSPTYVPTARTLSEVHIGASLGSAGQLALYNRLRTYMTSVGVP
jgi:hypothetical protein